MADNGSESATGAPAPRENPDLVGQAAAERAFLAAQSSGRFAHAWLISGPRGVGKATFAYRAARHLLAGSPAQSALFGAEPAPGEGGAAEEGSLYLDPADPVFRRIAAGGHADFLAVAPGYDDKRNRQRREITVAEIRAVGRFLAKTPAEGGWRVVVVDSADDLNPNAANALLKVLEEPPRRAALLLVAHNPARLLPTVRSRCRRLTLGPLGQTDVEALLARYCPELDAGDRAELARLGEGSIGRAVALAEAGGLALYRELTGLLDGLDDLDVPAVHALGDRVAGERNAEAFRTVTELLTQWLARRIRAAATTGENDARGLEPWIEVWEKVTTLLGRADGAHLDGKQVLLNAFFALESAARR